MNCRSIFKCPNILKMSRGEGNRFFDISKVAGGVKSNFQYRFKVDMRELSEFQVEVEVSIVVEDGNQDGLKYIKEESSDSEGLSLSTNYSLFTDEEKEDALKVSAYNEPLSLVKLMPLLNKVQDIILNKKVKGQQLEEMRILKLHLEEQLMTEGKWYAEWQFGGTWKEIREGRKALRMVREYLLENTSHNDSSGKRELDSYIFWEIQKSLRVKHVKCYDYPYLSDYQKYIAWKVVYYKESVEAVHGLMLLEALGKVLSKKDLLREDKKAFMKILVALERSSFESVLQKASQIRNQLK